MNTHQQVIEREKWLTVRRVAELLDMSESGVRREIRAGRLSAYRFGKLIKITWADFLKYRDSCLISGLS
jgi:excisionase family DNA binding protein